MATCFTLLPVNMSIISARLSLCSVPVTISADSFAAVSGKACGKQPVSTTVFIGSRLFILFISCFAFLSLFSVTEQLFIITISAVKISSVFLYPCSSIAFAIKALSYWLTLQPKVCTVYLIISLP